MGVVHGVGRRYPGVSVFKQLLSRYPGGPEVCVGGIVDRSVTLSRKSTQPNRDGGSGCYPRVRGENLWRFGGKGGGPSADGSLETCLVEAGRLVDRGFGGNGRMVTVAVETRQVARPGYARTKWCRNLQDTAATRVPESALELIEGLVRHFAAQPSEKHGAAPSRCARYPLAPPSPAARECPRSRHPSP